MKSLFVTVVFTVVSLTTSAKDNFKMTGKIDGAGNDTLCIEYVILQPKKQIITHKVAIYQRLPRRGRNGNYGGLCGLRRYASAIWNEHEYHQ